MPIAANKLPIVDIEKTAPLVVPAVCCFVESKRMTKGLAMPNANKLGANSKVLDRSMPSRMSDISESSGRKSVAKAGVTRVHNPAAAQR